MNRMMKVKTIFLFKDWCPRIVGMACLLVFLWESPAAAQTTLRDVFRAMPDSLMPYLTQNNRLDLIDFFESGMKAEVTNELDGKSQLTAMTADSLSLQLSSALRVDMLLLPVSGTVADSVTHVVCVLSTYGVNPSVRQTVVRYYSPQWQPFTGNNIPLSPANRKRVEHAYN